MATLPHPHPGRFPFSRGRLRSVGSRLLSLVLSTPDRAARAQDPSVTPTSDDERGPSRATTIVPVLVSLAGLVALAVGAALVGREMIGLVTSLLSGS